MTSTSKKMDNKPEQADSGSELRNALITGLPSILGAVIAMVAGFAVAYYSARSSFEQKTAELATSRQLKDVDAAHQYVTLAVSILRAEPNQDERERALRWWAVAILDAKSPVALSPEAKALLVSQKLDDVGWHSYTPTQNSNVDYVQLSDTRFRDAATHRGAVRCASSECVEGASSAPKP